MRGSLEDANRPRRSERQLCRSETFGFTATVNAAARGAGPLAMSHFSKTGPALMAYPVRIIFASERGNLWEIRL
jgi:hypothetical protein